MSITIWKYPLFITDVQELEVPNGFKPLHVGVQNGQLTLWAEVGVQSDLIEVSHPLELANKVRIRVIGTGNRMPLMAGFKYVGTADMPPFIWHVYSEVR